MIEAQHAHLHARLAKIDIERENTTNQLANLAAPDRSHPADIDALMTGLGGLTTILGAATPPEKNRHLPGAGLRLVYQPDHHAVVATC